MQVVLTLGDAALVLMGLAALQFLIGAWIKARLESSIKSEYDRLIERFDATNRGETPPESAGVNELFGGSPQGEPKQRH